MKDMTDQVDVHDLFFNLMEECSIVAQYIMPGIPHQNGVAERRNHTLKDMIKGCLLYTSPSPRDS